MANLRENAEDIKQASLRKCEICDVEFKINKYYPNKRFCSAKCRATIIMARNAFLKGHRPWNKGKEWPELSKQRIGKNNPAWKGGRIYEQGYVLLKAYGHPRADRSNYVFEHILIMEEHLGRQLEKNEVVHHMNHKRDDNRTENLMLMTRSEHSSHHIRETNARFGGSARWK